MRRLVSVIPLCALLALAQPSRAGTEADSACGAPEEFVTTDAPLAQLAAAIAAGGPVDVLAVGSATTVGSVSHDRRHERGAGGGVSLAHGARAEGGATRRSSSV